MIADDSALIIVDLDRLQDHPEMDKKFFGGINKLIANFSALKFPIIAMLSTPELINEKLFVHKITDVIHKEFMPRMEPSWAFRTVYVCGTDVAWVLGFFMDKNYTTYYVEDATKDRNVEVMLEHNLIRKGLRVTNKETMLNVEDQR